MAINILMFEIKEAERKYLEEHPLEGYNRTLYEECLDEEFIKNLPEEVLENTNVISIFNNSVLIPLSNAFIFLPKSACFKQLCTFSLSVYLEDFMDTFCFIRK